MLAHKTREGGGLSVSHSLAQPQYSCVSYGVVRSAATGGNSSVAYSLPPSESGGAGGGSEGTKGGGATDEGSREAGLLRVPYELARSMGGPPSVGLIIFTMLGMLLVRVWRRFSCPLCEGMWGEGRGGRGHHTHTHIRGDSML